MYENLLKDCLKKKKLWEDPDFKAKDSSVYYNECPVDGDIEWKRPSVSILLTAVLFDIEISCVYVMHLLMHLPINIHKFSDSFHANLKIDLWKLK